MLGSFFILRYIRVTCCVVEFFDGEKEIGDTDLYVIELCDGQAAFDGAGQKQSICGANVMYIYR